jgi:hypothetical protein
MKTKPTKGVKGFILRTIDNDHIFRVYEPFVKGEMMKFTDYDILHYDLEVEILDDAVFCDNGERQWIDYEDYRNE